MPYQSQLPRVVVHILRYNIGEIKRVFHCILAMFHVPSWCHVTSAPSTISVVVVAGTKMGWNRGIRLKGALFPVACPSPSNVAT